MQGRRARAAILVLFPPWGQGCAISYPCLDAGRDEVLMPNGGCKSR